MYFLPTPSNYSYNKPSHGLYMLHDEKEILLARGTPDGLEKTLLALRSKDRDYIIVKLKLIEKMNLSSSSITYMGR